MIAEDYSAFLARKVPAVPLAGFDVPLADLRGQLAPWQARVVRWALRGGRRCLFEATGLGKTRQALAVADATGAGRGRTRRATGGEAVGRGPRARTGGSDGRFVEPPVGFGVAGLPPGLADDSAGAEKGEEASCLARALMLTMQPLWPAPPGPPHAWEPPRTVGKVPERTAKLRALGNACTPAQAYLIFAAIMASEEG